MSYKIVRYYYPTQNKENRVMERGLSLDEAQKHCQDPKTAKKDVYFDGYTEE
jgi:hypothetical protein